MTEGRAFLLILVSAIALMVVGVLTLEALGANEEALSLAVIVPAGLAANAVSRVVMHYGESGRRRH